MKITLQRRTPQVAQQLNEVQLIHFKHKKMDLLWHLQEYMTYDMLGDPHCQKFMFGMPALVQCGNQDYFVTSKGVRLMVMSISCFGSHDTNLRRCTMWKNVHHRLFFWRSSSVYPLCWGTGGVAFLNRPYVCIVQYND